MSWRLEPELINDCHVVGLKAVVPTTHNHGAGQSGLVVILIAASMLMSGGRRRAKAPGKNSPPELIVNVLGPEPCHREDAKSAKSESHQGRRWCNPCLLGRVFSACTCDAVEEKGGLAPGPDHVPHCVASQSGPGACPSFSVGTPPAQITCRSALPAKAGRVLVPFFMCSNTDRITDLITQ